VKPGNAAELISQPDIDGLNHGNFLRVLRRAW
jgi:hypothetical protein